MKSKPQTGKVQATLRIILGMFLFYAGIGHLSFLRIEFVAQVPNWVPLPVDFVVVASGVVEILLGLALVIFVQYRVWAGYATAIFFILVFPGNIAQYINRIDAFGLNSDTLRLVRLFFQPVLVAWALWSTGAWQHFRRGKSGA